MATLNCRSIRETLLTYIGEQTDVIESTQSCVITLPIKTVDARWVDVYVDRRAADFFVVHDGGKTFSELISHGVKMSDARFALLIDLAQRFGATVRERSFVIGCKADGLQEAILAIAQCAGLGMFELLKHSPTYPDLPLYGTLRERLEAWARNRAKIDERVPVRGKTLQHEFDFVAHPLRKGQTIAIKVLNPSYTPMITAKQYGFLALDVAQSEYRVWKRLVILARGDEWTPESVDLIEKHAQRVVSIRSQDLIELGGDLTQSLNALYKAAA